MKKSFQGYALLGGKSESTCKSSVSIEFTANAMFYQQTGGIIEKGGEKSTLDTFVLYK